MRTARLRNMAADATALRRESPASRIFKKKYPYEINLLYGGEETRRRQSFIKDLTFYRDRA